MLYLRTGSRERRWAASRTASNQISLEAGLPQTSGCFALEGDRASEDCAGFLQKISDITQKLDEAYANSLRVSDGSSNVRGRTNNLSDFIRFVYLLNSYISVRPESYDTLWNRAVFRLIRTFERDEKFRHMALSVESRNHIGISLVLAWQLSFEEGQGLLLGLRTTNEVNLKGLVDRDQLTSLLLIAKEYWGDDMPLRLLFRTSPEKITASFRNKPEYPELLAETRWNRRSALQILFSKDINRFSKSGISEFSKVGPFKYSYVPSQLDSNGFWEYRKTRASCRRKPRIELDSGPRKQNQKTQIREFYSLVSQIF